MRIQTVNIIKDLVSTLGETVIVTDVTNLPGGAGSRLDTTCTWWLSIGCTVTIGANDFIITAFVINESITINGTPMPTPTSFTIPPPFYLHGTLKNANSEVDAQDDKEDVFPLAYLFEVIKDKKNTDDESMIDREVDLRIFWLQTANTADWLTEDHYLNLIEPMQQMVDLFIRKLENSRLFTDDFNYDCLNLIDVSENGTQEKALFDCNLSGIELRLFAEIREDLSCDNICKCSI